MDVAKHLDTGCYVKGTNKHKYTCLNKTCLLHKWICIKHTKENRPLLEANHEEATNGNQKMPFLRPYMCKPHPTPLLHPKGLPTPVPPAMRYYYKPRVVDISYNSEDSDNIPPTLWQG